jgi:ABC-type oligopeptide transport system ATPase subunit
VNLERFSDTGVPLLSGVSLNVQAGQVVGIIGPSGSGKSTLLRCLNRLWEPPADSVFLDGEDVTKMNVLTTRRRIGMLFQTPILFEGNFSIILHDQNFAAKLDQEIHNTQFGTSLTTYSMVNYVLLLSSSFELILPFLCISSSLFFMHRSLILFCGLGFSFLYDGVSSVHGCWF